MSRARAHSGWLLLCSGLGLLGCRARNEGSPERSNFAPPAASVNPASLASGAVPSLVVHQVAADVGITIDGALDEPTWATAASTGEFVNVGTGGPNTSPAIGGRARLFWTTQALYLAIEIRDTDIRGDFDAGATDPHLWTESTAEIMVDPDGDGDNRDYYEIQLGPQNLIFDSRFDDYNQPRVLPAGPFGHQEWSAKATRAVKVSGTLNDSSDKDRGYVVEAKIPWSSFDRAKSSPPKLGDQWRMNFYAMRNNGGAAWSPILGQGNFHKASRFGRVTWAGLAGNTP